MSSEKYIGLDVHQATISVAVLDCTGKLVMESILETKAATILEFFAGLRGTVSVTFEEGTWAAWLPQKEYNNPTITNTTCKARLRFIPSSVLCDARLLPPFLLQIVRVSAVMRPILEPCEHPQCEQNASPPRIGLPQELQGPRRGPRNTK